MIVIISNYTYFKRKVLHFLGCGNDALLIFCDSDSFLGLSDVLS